MVQFTFRGRTGLLTGTSRLFRVFPHWQQCVVSFTLSRRKASTQICAVWTLQFTLHNKLLCERAAVLEEICFKTLFGFKYSRLFGVWFRSHRTRTRKSLDVSCFLCEHSQSTTFCICLCEAKVPHAVWTGPVILSETNAPKPFSNRRVIHNSFSWATWKVPFQQKENSISHKIHRVPQNNTQKSFN